MATMELNERVPGKFSFRVRLADRPTDEQYDRLFEAMPDDPAIESGPAGASVSFERDGEDFTDVVLEALNQLVTAGVEPVAVEDELVTAKDIADRTGRSRQSISQLIHGHRGPGGFPSPAASHTRSPLWHWNDVVGWFETLGGGQPLDQAQHLEQLNVALAARRLDPQLTRRLNDALTPVV
jgi:hypothetical protein